MDLTYFDDIFEMIFFDDIFGKLFSILLFAAVAKVHLVSLVTLAASYIVRTHFRYSSIVDKVSQIQSTAAYNKGLVLV